MAKFPDIYDIYHCVQDFIDDVNANTDIEFQYKGKDYSVTSVIENGEAKICFVEFYKDNEILVDTAEEVLEKGMIEGQPLKDLILKVKVYLH